MADGHGGPRQGTPGRAYGNRVDMLNNYAHTPTGGTAPIPAGARAAGTPGGGPPMPPPGVVPLNAPTDRPGEHVMSGAPTGPGPGPAELGLPPAGPSNPLADKLRGLYLADPDPGLAEMIALINDGWL